MPKFIGSLGNVLGKQRKFRQSLKFFDKAIDLDSTNSRIWESAMVQDPTPAHKGLSPSKLVAYINVSQRHPCRAHTTVSTRTWPLTAVSKFGGKKKF